MTDPKARPVLPSDTAPVIIATAPLRETSPDAAGETRFADQDSVQGQDPGAGTEAGAAPDAGALHSAYSVEVQSAEGSRAEDSSQKFLREYPKPPFPEQTQELPGSFQQMHPRPDHGEESWRGSGRLQDKVAVITGGDSGIGRAVAIAYAREGADLVLSYLSETADAEDTARLVQEAGCRCLRVAGDIAKAGHCRAIIDGAIREFGRIDILVNNAAHQDTFKSLEEITDEEWRRTFAVNIDAIFYLSKAAAPYMAKGSSIINTASINADMPNPTLLAYATTKGAIQNFTGGLAQMLAEKGIRVNCVAPGPVWTPLIPASMSGEKVAHFGEGYPMKRPAQPVELAAAYVMLAEPAASYISGATIAVTGGKPLI